MHIRARLRQSPIKNRVCPWRSLLCAPLVLLLVRLVENYKCILVCIPSTPSTTRSQYSTSYSSMHTRVVSFLSVKHSAASRTRGACTYSPSQYVYIYIITFLLVVFSYTFIGYQLEQIFCALMNDLYVKLCNIFVRMTVMDWPSSAFQILASTV